ncbi:MAG: hypothetical protein KF696_03090 [Planctomycetes bacterium]|nr:hypothetical protein [Planctomycetota bacterium]MCW8134991.1 hypothetical protein [Planctomycetota bacterium]
MRTFTLAVLLFLIAGCGATNTPPGNQPSGGSTAAEPASASEARDAWIKGMGSMDTLTLLRLLTKADREKVGDEFDKLKERVDKIVITETSFEQKGDYWVFTYSQVAHMKGGKTDGDDRKVAYIVKEDDKWRISMSEPK